MDTETCAKICDRRVKELVDEVLRHRREGHHGRGTEDWYNTQSAKIKILKEVATEIRSSSRV
jgi:hypothetical protein